MSKQDNLTDFLTDVADAIREKKGSSEKINPQNFSEEIRSIESGGSGGFNFTGEVFDPSIISQTNYKSIRFNEGVTTMDATFINNMTALESLYLPSTLTKIPISAVGKADSLSVIVVDPRNPVYDSRNGCNAVMRKSDNELIFGCKGTIIPEETTSLGYGAFATNRGLTSIVIPSNVKTFGAYCFNGCTNLGSITLNEVLTSISIYGISQCTKLRTIVFPSTINSLQMGALSGNTAMVCYDFSKHTIIPRMYNINALNGIPSTCAIVVPDALYDEWKSATNWSTYADRIVKASEYQPNNE